MSSGAQKRVTHGAANRHKQRNVAIVTQPPETHILNCMVVNTRLQLVLGKLRKVIKIEKFAASFKNNPAGVADESTVHVADELLRVLT